MNGARVRFQKRLLISLGFLAEKLRVSNRLGSDIYWARIQTGVTLSDCVDCNIEGFNLCI